MVLTRRTCLIIFSVTLGCFIFLVLSTYTLLQQAEHGNRMTAIVEQDWSDINHKLNSVRKTDIMNSTDGKPEVAARMDVRAKRVQLICSDNQWKSRMGDYKTSHRYLKSINNSFAIFYCPVPKAAWSTWKHLFYSSAGIEHLMSDMQHTGWSSEWFKAGLTVVKVADDALRHDQRLVVVRDPYDRLVSSYKDKVLGGDGYYVKQTKRPCKNIDVNSTSKPVLTFSTFVDCILTTALMKRTRLDQFGAGHYLDIHWKPQTLLCQFCSVQYNLIVHIETFDEDVIHSLRKLNMTTPLVQENKSANKTKALLNHYYSQLSEEQMNKVHQLYFYDRLLLGYDKFIVR